MRDPDRIDKFINVIRGVWKRYPDLRLGQLLLNVIEGNYKQVNKEFPELDIELKTIVLAADREQQLYNIEDGELISRIVKLYRRG